MARNKTKFVSIGKILSSHGVHGFTKVLPLTDFPERFEQVKRVFLFKEDKQELTVNIEQVRFTNTNLLIKFTEFNSPESINNYRNHLIKIPQEETLELPEDLFYIDDLNGMEAFSTDGKLLGKVVNVYSNATDILEIVTPEKKEVMVPFVKEIVTNVDNKSRKITINPIPGLFDDNFELDQ